MAISLVGSATNVAINSTTGITLDLTGIAGLAENDVIYAVVNANATTNLTMTASAGWTKLADLYANDTLDSNMAVFRKVMGATPDTDVTFGGTTSSFHWAAAAMALRGVDVGAPEDTATTTITGINTGTVNCPAITTVTADAWVLALGGSTQFGTAVVPTGYSNLVSAQNGVNPTHALISTNQVASPSLANPPTYGGIVGDTGDSWTGATVAVRAALYQATAAITEAGDTVSAAATLTLSGAAAITEGGDALAATGALPIIGALSASEDGDTVAATATIEDAGSEAVAGHPRPFGQRRVILRNGQVLVARNDAEYQIAVQYALQEMDEPNEALPKRSKKRERRAVEVSALTEPEQFEPLPAAFFDGIVEQLSASIQQSQLLRLWNDYQAMAREEEDVEMILLAA